MKWFLTSAAGKTSCGWQPSEANSSSHELSGGPCLWRGRPSTTVGEKQEGGIKRIWLELFTDIMGLEIFLVCFLKFIYFNKVCLTKPWSTSSGFICHVLWTDIVNLSVPMLLLGKLMGQGWGGGGDFILPGVLRNQNSFIQVSLTATFYRFPGFILRGT